MYQNGLIRRIMLVSNFMTPHLVNNCNTHIAQYLESKSSQTMKFGQLIKCNMRNIFFEKSYTKCGGENSPRPFSEKLKYSISLDQSSKVLLMAS